MSRKVPKNTSQEVCILHEILSELRFMNMQNKIWMTIDCLSKYIGLEESTIYQYTHRKKIPFRKIPGSSKLIFSRREIDAWIEKGQVDNEDKKVKDIANNIWDGLADKSKN